MPSCDVEQVGADRRRIRIVHTKGCSDGELLALIAAHERALASREDVLKDGPRTAVTRVRLGGQSYCVKEYRRSSFLDRIKDWLRGRRDHRAWRAAGYLAARDIPTPQPVALAKDKAAGYLVTRFVEGAVPLNRLLKERFGGPPSGLDLAAKRAMVRQLGRWLRRVHDLGVYHDDWSPKNILAIQSGQEWVFYVLDLESMSPRKRLSYRRRVKNLGQISDVPFGVTRTDRMRFLIAYAQEDRGLTRGRFPRDVLAVARRREEAWARSHAKALRRKMRIAR